MIRHALFIVGLLWAGMAAPALAQPAQSESLPPTQKVPNTMEERVRACAGCHGERGRGVENVYFPRLAGKPAGYLYNQLLAFKDGRRHYAPMTYLLAYLPAPYLQKMAEYYAAQNEPFPPHKPANVSEQFLKRGQELVTRGDASRQIPACVACHGQALNGREPGIPALLGLRADYVSAQLGAWRYGTRTALAPDCMQLVAARMTEDDVTAVAAWLSSLPVPADHRPLPPSAVQLPLKCGSQP